VSRCDFAVVCYTKNNGRGNFEEIKELFCEARLLRNRYLANDNGSMADYTQLENLHDIFELYPEIKLVYLFGSRARKKDGPLSDYDFAVYLDENNTQRRFEIRLDLMAKVSMRLKTDDVDVCIMNDLDAPELNYNIVREGKLIYEKEPFKVLVEPKIFNEYFDFIYLLRKYNLTRT